MRFIVTLTMSVWGSPVSKEYEVEAVTAQAAITEARAQAHAAGQTTLAHGKATVQEVA
jgi:hypothetical protein